MSENGKERDGDQKLKKGRRGSKALVMDGDG